MTPLKSQLLGLLLGLATAVGCIFYEKIVVNFSYISMLILYVIFELVFLFVAGFFIFDNDLKADYHKFISEPKYIWYTLVWATTGVTSLCWYYITRNQGIMTGSLYEVKYILMLALIYIVFGENRFTWNTAIGIMFAIGSIYFISRN